MKNKKFAVVLSGCGVYDGAEIHEATLTLLSIANNGAEYQCFAPDINQAHVINHITGEEMSETRNVLIEAARIARGNIKPLSEYKAEDYDAIIFPGGFGVAKNLLCGRVGEYVGNKAPIFLDGKVAGMAVITKPKTKPIYVSVGNMITLDKAVKIVEKCVKKSRIPEPIRIAHILTKTFREKN